ncbi:nitrite reductase large subunit NirB [Paenibacillus sp. HB172176]|uniref:nitrite reductase large subunit NirB n=1 Tax=Paenibacillus sp. HB172176 TaxID=2493690 RepID=UPI00143CB897|nr:nitrite reductase large subunit NirB [Paenibacillus sp. HB172176]
MKKKLVVIGNGMAGVRCVEEIIAISPDRYEITIIGAEPHTNYNRIMLSKVLQGNTSIDDITINPQSWYDDNGITLFKGEAAIGIDASKRSVTTEAGRKISYDKLILATGSNPFMLPLPGADKQGVTAFRDIKDCETMMETAKTHNKAVVIGGGLLGLEAARGLLNLGMQVSVVHLNAYLMERQLDQTAAELMREELEKQGMQFLLGKSTERILGRKRVEGLQFTDGSREPADLVVFAVGIRPNMRLAADSGIEVNRAIVVNDRMETSVPDVYAVGECAEHRGMAYGLVAPLYEQGKVLAKVVCDVETEGYQGSTLYSQLKVSGLEVFSAGEIKDTSNTVSLKVYDGIKRTYKKINVQGNRIVGAVLFGDSGEGSKLLGYIKQGANVSVLEQDAAGAGGSGMEAEAIAAMPEHETVCSCNGVSKGAIVAAVCEQGLKTSQEVRDCTRASSSCGGCKPLMEAILTYALENGSGAKAKEEPICGCTEMGHEEAKEALHELGLRANDTAWRRLPIERILLELGWSNEEGCGICRPAMRYYADRYSRQGSGARSEVSGDNAKRSSVRMLRQDRYAVMPATHAGVITAEQLRMAADAMERFEIPMAKLSADARLELLGIEEHRVGAVANALEGGGGLDSHSFGSGFNRSAEPISFDSFGQTAAYYRAAVVTCGGKNFEPHAIRDSVEMGIGLERELEGLAFPSPLSLGVSSSPLHQAGTLTKALGLVGAPSGWELYLGGSDGRRMAGNSVFGEVKQAMLLATELNDALAMEMSLALLEWYRMTADYGQSAAEWLDKLGMVAVRERIFDVTSRQLLLAELRSRSAAFDGPGNNCAQAKETDVFDAHNEQLIGETAAGGDYA